MAFERQNDVILHQLRLKLQKEDYSETILQQDPRYRHYCSQIDRLTVQDDVVIWDYYDETGNVQYRQALLPKNLVSELLQSLHGKANKHPGFSKMLYEIRQFLANFDWADSSLNPTEIAQIEGLLVELHDNFARHRFDIGMNEDFKVKLTPKDDSRVFVKACPHQLISRKISLLN